MQRLLKNLFSRVVIFSLAILIQLAVLVLVIWKFSSYFVFFYAICALASLAAVLIIVNSRSNPAYKIAWIVPIMLFPIFGGLFYLMFGGNRTSQKAKPKCSSSAPKSLMPGQDLETIEQLEKENLGQLTKPGIFMTLVLVRFAPELPAII